MLQYARLLFKEMREKADVCAITFTYPQLCCETGGEAYDRRTVIYNNLFIIQWIDSFNNHKRCLNNCSSNINN